MKRIGLAALWLLTACNVVALNRSLARGTFHRAGLTSHQIELRSGSMHYWEGGSPSGPLLVLLHGFGFSALETWDGQVKSFASHFHIIAPDLYWFGQSRPNDTADTALAQADALDELLGKLGVEHASVVGISFGGYVAIDLALSHPSRVSRLVLVDAAGLAPTSAEEAQISANFGHAPSVREVLIPADVNGLRAVLRQLIYRRRWIPDWVLRQILHQEFWQFREAKGRILDGMVKPGGFLPPERLAAISARTLVVWGRHDPLILPSMGERMARSIPGAQLEWMENSGHAATLEEPKLFNLRVLRFLGD